ncbi:MAG: 1,4-dihydroxy-2-naphthoate octaprenyltransferase [Bacteriovoracaceae bacterium]|nr:1,4-dihydroxy-2-naphthoate octaprenyltransferase [Bacteriovoracaceae bacterium]
MTQVQAWLMATRPKTLTATLAPILVGSALAYRYQSDISLFLVACALFCTLCLQITTNLVNDVADFKKGTDTPDRLGPPRATAQGWLSPKAVWMGTGVAILGALLSGYPLMVAGGWPLVILGVVSILAAIAYTAGPFPLAYNGLGEVFVLIFFGWVAIGGLSYALTGAFPVPGAGLAGTQIGLLSVAMIAINNLRDIHGDKKSGKKTLAARYGENFIRAIISSALLSPYVMGVLWWPESKLATLLPALSLIFAVKVNSGVQKTAPSKELNAYLGKASLHLLIFGILLTIALLWK